MLRQVILFMTDTQRKDMITAYNKSKEMHTPALDSLAGSGVTFQRAYTAQPVCGPARSCLFTGTYPHTNGMIANSMALNEKSLTIGQRLANKNIKTGYVGKWHLDGGDYFGDGLCPKGWDPDYWFDMRNYLDLMTEDDRLASRQFETALNHSLPAEFTYAHQCSDKAIDFIENHKDQSFFLVVSYDEPHHPFIAPQKYYKPFEEDPHHMQDNINYQEDKTPDHIKLWAKHDASGSQDTAKGLLGCNAFVDTEIDRVVTCIQSNLEAPCLIYTSDHGAALGAHGLTGKGPAMYEEITNIPLIIHCPSLFSPRVVDHLAVSHVDLVPTILDFFDLALPASLEGDSLLPLLKEMEKGRTPKKRQVYMEFTRYEIDHDGFGGFQPIRAVTDGRYKLVVNLMTTDELYDTQEDPGEKNNLIDSVDHQQLRNTLHNNLLNWMNETRDPYRGYYWSHRPWRQDLKDPSWACAGMTRQRVTEENETRQLDYSTGLPIKEHTRPK